MPVYFIDEATEPGPRGPQGPPGPGGGTVTAPAAQNLSGHRAVTLTGGQLDYADPATIGNQPVGVTVAAASQGVSATAIIAGELEEGSWNWTPGNVYLASNGVLTQTEPSAGALVIIATATGATSLYVTRQPTIDL